MPIYEYQCVDCGGRDQRVAGLDDHTALCAQCGGLMLRLDEDVFQPYFEEVAERLARNQNQSFTVTWWDKYGCKKAPLGGAFLLFSLSRLFSGELLPRGHLGL